MNTSRHRLVSFRSTLLFLALLAATSFAQESVEPAFLPEGVEATGDTAEVKALTAWAKEHQHSHPDQARQATERALALARKHNDRRGIGWSLATLGDLTSASDLHHAEAYYTEAHEVFEQINDKRGLNYSQLGMGDVYSYRGELKQAAIFYFDALEGFQRLGDSQGQAAALNGIGITHEHQGDWEEALTYYEQAITLAETLDDSLKLVSILNNAGNTLTNLGIYESAEIQFRRALEISEERGARFYTAFLSNNLGALFNKQDRHEGALPLLFRAENLGKELERDVFLGAVYDEIGKAYMGLGEYDRALDYASESLVITQETGSLSNQMEVHQTLSQIYAAAGNYEQAFFHHQQYATVGDSVFSEEKTEAISEMQTRYDTEEKQRAIERLEQENQIQALRASRRQIFLLGGILVALLIAGLFYYRYRVKQKANRLLEELDAAKSRFFANISHEFRTPLTVILGGLQDTIVGRFGKIPEKVAAQQKAMLRNTRQLQGLIDEVLDLNRLEAGKLGLKPAPGDLFRSLHRIVEAAAPLAERNSINLTFEPNVDHCPRLYDEEKLEKIVGNLLSNALKFTPKGGSVRVALRCKEETEIIVSDDGPGIPEEAQAKVFERFAQVEDGSHHGGTGIGLALAKELAELHGGTITLESEPGEGSTFTVRLPLEKVALDDVVGATGLPRRSSTEPGRSPLQKEKPVPPEEFVIGGNGADFSGQPVVGKADETEPDRTTVLVIEDNADVQAYVRRSLEETYRVIEAADGEAGLQQARKALPDLIVSDVMLPGIDGYEVARRLKAEADTECISVVMLTARAAEEDQTEGYGAGAEVYITKPFSPETLRAAIARLLEERLRLRRRLQKETTKEAEEKMSINGHPTLSDRLRTVVLENLHDEDFGVDELATTLGMSRTVLYDDLQEESDLTPAVLIRTVRIERARELLADGTGSVSEVAYAVGFKSLSHFTRSFREHYGELPSSVLDTQ